MSALRVLAVVALAAAARPAHGFVRSATESGQPLFWPTPIVSYLVNGAPPGRSSPTCAADAALGAVQASFEAWQQSCSHLRLEYGGPTDEIRTGVTTTAGNVVVFREGFCSLHPQARFDECIRDPEVDCGGIYNCFEDGGSRRTLALTSVLFRPSTGRIVHADIEIAGWDGSGDGSVLSSDDPQRGWYFTCVDPAAVARVRCTSYGQAGCFFADLQNTVTHEAGHFVGLRHVCDGGSPDDADLPSCQAAHVPVTMFPFAEVGEIDKRSLEGDDVAGVCAAYPDDGGDGCGCGSGSPGLAGVASLLALVALRPLRRRARRAPPASRTILRS